MAGKSLAYGAVMLLSLASLAVGEDTVVTSTDGVRLSGVWSVPTSEVRAVAVILQGSGNVGADGDVSGPYTGTGYRGASAKLSEQLADALLSSRVATLRYAKRGFEDAAQLPNQTIPYLVRDARAALAHAKARFPRAKTAYVGFSEGGLVAALAASEEPVDALFLLAPLTRDVDSALAYQFVEWPVDLLRAKVDTDGDAVLSPAELTKLGSGGTLPLLGVAWKALDADGSDSLSIAAEVLPAYLGLHRQVMGMMTSPPFAGWYASLKALPPFSQYAARISSPVYLYQALEDAQMKWSWVSSDQRLFAGPVQVAAFPALGHCFAPMDGGAGEVKTSGPFEGGVLGAVARDLRAAFKL